MIPPSLHSLFLFVGPLVGLLAAAPASPPVSDFVRRPEISAASISEDGRYVSFLTPGKKDFFDLNVYDLETKESKKFDLGGDDVMASEWIDAHRLILTTRNRPEYRFRQQVFDVRLGKITGNLTYKLDKGIMGHADTVLRVVSSLRRDPSLFTAWFFDYDGERSGLATISLKLQPRSGLGHSNARYNVKEWINLPPRRISRRLCGPRRRDPPRRALSRPGDALPSPGHAQGRMAPPAARLRDGEHPRLRSGPRLRLRGPLFRGGGEQPPAPLPHQHQ